MKIKKMVGTGVEIILAGIVLVFLGMKSVDFFMFTTPADQWYYSYLGFALTGAGAVGYLLIFMTAADTDLKKVISVGMMVVCFLGEIATAGFGMQIEAWERSGFALTESDMDFMILSVQVLAFLHAFALVAYVAGDKIGELFADKDANGVPDIIQAAPLARAYNSDTEIAKLKERLAQLENPTKGGK